MQSIFKMTKIRIQTQKVISNRLFPVSDPEGLSVNFYRKVSSSPHSSGAIFISSSFSLMVSTKPRAKPLHPPPKTKLPTFLSSPLPNVKLIFLQLLLSLRICYLRESREVPSRMLWNLNLPKQINKAFSSPMRFTCNRFLKNRHYATWSDT